LEDEDGLEMDIDGFSGESWNPREDIRAFTTILSEIVVGTAAEQGCGNSGIPSFVLDMIEGGECPNWNTITSFSGALSTLKEHNFKIMEGVDAEEVSRFVRWVESSERFTE
jgi:hypothetical protein